MVERHILDYRTCLEKQGTVYAGAGLTLEQLFDLTQPHLALTSGLIVDGEENANMTAFKRVDSKSSSGEQRPANADKYGRTVFDADSRKSTNNSTKLSTGSASGIPSPSAESYSSNASTHRIKSPTRGYQQQATSSSTVSSASSSQNATELEYLREYVDCLLGCLMSANERQSASLRYLLREILAFVLLNSIDRLCEPEFLFELILMVGPVSLEIATNTRTVDLGKRAGTGT